MSRFCDRRFRIFNMANDYNRESLVIEAVLSLPSTRVIGVLGRIVVWRGYTVKIKLYNWPESISLTLTGWVDKHALQLEFIKPGKPTKNCYVEPFNRTFQTKVLNMYARRLGGYLKSEK